MYCHQCGQKNSPENRFCGACGTKLYRQAGEPSRPEPVRENPSTPDASAVSDAVAQPTAAEREAEPNESRRAPIYVRRESAEPRSSIGGASILGLNAVESDEETSYLLEEDEGGGRSWRGTVVLLIVLAVLALVVLQWKSNNPQAWDRAVASITQRGQSEKQAAKEVEQPQEPVAGHSEETQPNAASTTQPKPDKAANSTKDQMNQDASSEKSPAEQKSGDKGQQDKTSPATVKPKQSDNAEPAQQEPAQSSGGDDSAVRQAESLLAGGAANCNPALRILRSAAQQGNPRAQIKLGAMYATGSCVSQDRVAAYQWFTRAAQVEPRNTSLDHSRSMLWVQMTESEKNEAMNASEPKQPQM